MTIKLELEKDEVEMLLHAVEQLIHRWEFVGIDIGSFWYVLRDKLYNALKRQ